MAEQSVFFGGRSPSGLNNLLLILNLLGIIIIIVLLLWWWPWYWGHAHGIVKDGTGVATSPGGNIIIDTCCDGKTTGCPTPPPPSDDCKSTCARLDPSGGTAYQACVEKRCGPTPPPPGTTPPPPTTSCKDSCTNKYGAGTTATQTCIRDECCEESCKERYGGMTGNYYSQCVQTECNQPTPPPSPGPCQDTDGGLDYNTIGAVYTGQGTAPACRDKCGNSLDLQECRCLDGKSDVEPYRCPNGCEDGRCVPTTTPPPPTYQPPPPSTTSNDPCTEYCQNAYAASGPTFVQQCITEHWCPV